MTRSDPSPALLTALQLPLYVFPPIRATLSGLVRRIKDAAMQASAVCKPDPSSRRRSEGSVLPQTSTMSVPDYVSERYETFEEYAK